MCRRELQRLEGKDVLEVINKFQNLVMGSKVIFLTMTCRKKRRQAQKVWN